MIKNLINKFRFRYGLALSLIMILAIAAFLTIFITVKLNSKNAEIINISGRQRMLSQRIAKSSVLLYEANTLIDKTVERTELIKSYELMKESHELLTSKLKDKGSKIDKRIYDFYFNENSGLDIQVKKFLKKADIFINGIQCKYSLSYILKATGGPLLENLDQAVKLHEKKSNLFQERLLKLEIIILLAAIFVLSLEVFFIFRPTEKTFVDFFKQEEEAKKKIEEKSQKIKELVFSLSHTFMEPARIIQCYIDLIKKAGKELDEDKKKLYCETIENQTKTIKARLDEIRDYVEEED